MTPKEMLESIRRMYLRDKVPWAYCLDALSKAFGTSVLASKAETVVAQ